MSFHGIENTNWVVPKIRVNNNNNNNKAFKDIKYITNTVHKKISTWSMISIIISNSKQMGFLSLFENIKRIAET